MSDLKDTILENQINEENIREESFQKSENPLENTEANITQSNITSETIQEDTNLNSRSAFDALDQVMKDEESEESNLKQPEVNCLALTVKKDYSLSILRNKIKRAVKGSWKIAVSIFVLNFLASFF